MGVIACKYRVKVRDRLSEFLGYRVNRIEDYVLMAAVVSKKNFCV